MSAGPPYGDGYDILVIQLVPSTLAPRPQLQQLVLGILPFVVSVDCPLCRSALSSITRSDTSAASERAGMATLKAYQPVKRLSKKVRRGFRGYPVATIAFYGPDAGRASKVAVGIVMTEGEEVADLRRWTSVDRDVRRDPAIAASILEFIAQFEVRTVVMTDRIIGCPHEEGIDYEGSVCPRCEFWANRDRWIGEVIH